ncbi:hypothetical protein FXO37_31518 [Capsicum annuum]|nr:hypothetical protein FXO37_31518 [Capsicum annuum]
MVKEEFFFLVPYIIQEALLRGFPVWLKYVPGIRFRIDNEPFKIENKYQPAREAPRKAGEAYVQWAAQMAVGLNTGFLWVMFVEFGGTIPLRPVQDLAFVVACFIQKGVSFVNYYMFHGGTNFRLTAGGPFITISYDYDAPIDEYGEINHRRPYSLHTCNLFVDISPSESFLRRGQKPTLNVHPNGHAVHVSVNGKPSGTSYGIQKDTKFNSTGLVDLQAETNRIELLSIAGRLPLKGASNVNGEQNGGLATFAKDYKDD